MVDIFISYAREDRAKAQSLAAVLRGRGWEAWWDFRLKAGEIWDEIIERRLAEAKCVVVLWSSTSINRHWVRAEANDGRERGILVPALLEKVRPPLAFRLVQAEDLTEWSGDPDHSGLLRLLDAISGHVQPLMPPLPPHPGPLPQAGEGDAHPGPLPLAGEGGTRASGRVRAFKDLEVFRDGDAPWCPEMVVIPAGSFLMGSPPNEPGVMGYERPQHRVTIGKQFGIGKYTVTVSQFSEFVKAKNYDCRNRLRVWNGEDFEPDPERTWRNPGLAQEYNHPVVAINWSDAMAFVEWLSYQTGQPYRLPTEAEWEHASRAGTTTPFSFGRNITTAQANYDGTQTYSSSQKGIKRGSTVSVGSLRANTWGLHEMHGNVQEWVIDSHTSNYDNARADGSAWWTTGGVVRGGSWITRPAHCRSAFRGSAITSWGYWDIGFRVARTL